MTPGGRNCHSFFLILLKFGATMSRLTKTEELEVVLERIRRKQATEDDVGIHADAPITRACPS
jgi:hypothetical protein